MKLGRINIALKLGSLVAVSALFGCAGGASTDTSGGDLGAVKLALQVAPGVSVNTLSYSISGPGSYSGTINVASSSTVGAVIGNIAAASGYSLTLHGTATDTTT
ncbi:MAG TPA: hypothetical protein VK989_17175, partial [Polyangia bacterium]|nr:hypothetical protein [Polyangia bacterium]